MYLNVNIPSSFMTSQNFRPLKKKQKTLLLNILVYGLNANNLNKPSCAACFGIVYMKA